MKTVAVCIATCNRNDLLYRALSSLSRSFALEKRYNKLLIVVDNNDHPSAKTVADSFSRKLNLVYEWESRPGIPYARNKALEVANKNNAHFIAFIDDDEWVDPSWLSTMLRSVDKAGVDIVSGAVFQENKGAVVAKRVLSNNARRDRAETDNIIIKSWITKQLAFDESMAQSGGTDVLFTRQAHEQGATIIACRDAVVYESMPKQRQTVGWKLQRHYRYGLTHCIIEKKLVNGSSTFFLVTRGIVLLPVGLLEFIAKIPSQGFAGSVSGLERMMRGIGTLAYFIGISYDEYKR